MNNKNVQFQTFLLLLVIVTVAFGWLLKPYYGALLWGATFAIIFMPLNHWFQRRLHGRVNLAAFLTVTLCILIVIIPVSFITGSLVQEGAAFYHKISSGQFDLANYFNQLMQALPQSAHDALAHLGLGDALGLQDKLSASAMKGSKFLATQAFNVGQNTAEFLISMGIMLYLLFFLLRDGPRLGHHIKHLVPLSDSHKSHLFNKFTTVIRATVKGNLAVAATQGLLGGIMFWILGIEGALLWGVIMGFLSLLPAVGAALIWFPVALFLLLSGAVVKGGILMLFGVLVIGLVDNVLRPLLVGKDTKMPDYVILISTLGGLTAFGLNGFVIGPLIAALFMACWDLFPSAIRSSEGTK